MEKTDCNKTIEVLQQLDEKGLLIIEFMATGLLAKQELDEEKKRAGQAS